MQLKIRILTNILYFVFCIENEWRKKSKREKKNYQIILFLEIYERIKMQNKNKIKSFTYFLSLKTINRS